MTSKRIAVACLLGSGVIALTGCSQAEPGTSAPAAPPKPPATKPQIANPKNLEAITDACQLLTPEQLGKLGTSTATEHRRSAWGEDSCTWGVDADGLQVNVAPSTKTKQGLTSVLKTVRKTAPDEQVDGYPMVTSDRATYTCGIYVQVNSDDTFAVETDKGSSGRPEHQDVCGVAKQVAGMVLTNLPPQGQ